MGAKVTITTQDYAYIRDNTTGFNGIYARFQKNDLSIYIYLDDVAYNTGSANIGSSHTIGVQLRKDTDTNTPGSATSASILTDFNNYTYDKGPNYQLKPDTAVIGRYTGFGIENGTYEIWTNGRQGDSDYPSPYKWNSVLNPESNDNYHFTGISITIYNNGVNEEIKIIKYYSLYFCIVRP